MLFFSAGQRNYSAQEEANILTLVYYLGSVRDRAESMGQR